MSPLESLAKVRNKTFCHVKLKNTIACSDWSSRVELEKIALHPSIQWSTERSIDRSISQSIDQSVSQPTSLSVRHHSLEARSKRVRTFKVAPYSFSIARSLMTKAQVICARSKKTSVFFDFYDVNMSTESKTDSKFPRVSFGKFFKNLAEL